MKQTLTAVVALAMILISTSILAHGGHPHTVGTVVSISADAIVVKTSAGEKSVGLTESTKYYHGSDEGHPAAAADVKAGMRVVVHLGGDGKAAEVHVPCGGHPERRATDLGWREAL
jgi:uncharacterized protein YabE (DUF348 family)